MRFHAPPLKHRIQRFDLVAVDMQQLHLLGACGTVYRVHSRLESDVFESVLHHISAKIRSLGYVMSAHADEEMDNGGLTTLGVEQVILTERIVAL